MTSDPVVQALNAHAPAIIRTLKGHVLTHDAERGEVRMAFEIGLDFCHSGDIVQGGLVTAMLDAAMAHVVLASESHPVGVSSIGIQVNFLRPARAGAFEALGAMVKTGRTVAYTRAELFGADGTLLATASSSSFLQRKTSPVPVPPAVRPG